MNLADLPQSLRRGAVLIGDDPAIPPDIDELARIERVRWQQMWHELREGGVPTADRQYFRAVEQDPPVSNQAAVTGVSAITALWAAPSLTGIPANSIRGGQMFKVIAYGVCTTAVTAAQTATFTPIFGTAVGGTSLGASIAAPLEAKVFTNTMWIAQMYVHFRTIGAAGTATCAGNIEALPFVGVAAGTAEGGSVPFGTGSATATTVDTTVASGLLLAITPSLSTQSWTTLGLAMEALN